MRTIRIDLVGIPLDVEVNVFDENDFTVEVINTVDENGFPLNELDLFLNERGQNLVFDLVAEKLAEKELIEPDDDGIRPLHFGDEGIFR